MRKLNVLIVIFLLMLGRSASAVGLVIDIPAPEGYQRPAVVAKSYAAYLRSLPLKQTNDIAVWNGSLLPEASYPIMAVVGLPLLFNEDIEQCADFGMRFWAEYMRTIGALDRLSLFDFYGNKKPFSQSGRSFRKYLQWHMRYSNSYSIKLGANKVRLLNELRAGDMFVQNESEEGIGHVSVVIDEAVNEAGQKVFLVGYSFMPAQQFHIEKADDEHGTGGWFTANGYMRYAQTSFGIFGKPVVMRFEDQ